LGLALVWLYSLPFNWKRYATFALTGVLADGFWLAWLGMGYGTVPVGWRCWLEQLVLVATTAFALGQFIHGEVKAREARISNA